MCDVGDPAERGTGAGRCSVWLQSEGGRKPVLGEVDTGGRSNERLIFCLFGFVSFFACITKQPQFVLVALRMRGRGVSWSQTADGNIF